MLNAFNNRSAYTNLSNQYGANNVYGGGNFNPSYSAPSVENYAQMNNSYLSG